MHLESLEQRGPRGVDLSLEVLKPLELGVPSPLKQVKISFGSGLAVSALFGDWRGKALPSDPWNEAPTSLGFIKLLGSWEPSL